MVKNSSGEIVRNLFVCAKLFSMSHFLLSGMFRQHPVLCTFCKISLGLCPGLPGPLAQVGRCVCLILEQLYSFSLGKGECVAVRRESLSYSFPSAWSHCPAIGQLIHPFGGQSGLWLASSQATCGGGAKQAGFVGSR